MVTTGGGLPGLPMSGVGGIILAALVIVAIVVVAKYVLDN